MNVFWRCEPPLTPCFSRRCQRRPLLRIRDFADCPLHPFARHPGRQPTRVLSARRPRGFFLANQFPRCGRSRFEATRERSGCSASIYLSLPSRRQHQAAVLHFIPSVPSPAFAAVSYGCPLVYKSRCIRALLAGLAPTNNTRGALDGLAERPAVLDAPR